MISVITLTYNNYDELICTINSLEGVSNIEHIIINGGTCAKTLNFLKSYHGISISEPDEGISDGFNKGIALSRSELVLFLNSGDTLVDKKYPLEAEKIFKKEKKLGIIHADLIFGDHLIGDIRLAALKKTELSDVSLGRGMPYHHQTMIFRKKLFDEFGNFDLNFKISMDYEWLCRFGHSQQYTVKYWNKSAPARMEGGGVSQKKEYLQIFETFLSLIKNKKLTLKNLNGLIKRVTNYTFRVVLERLNIPKLVIGYFFLDSTEFYSTKTQQD
jgi:glycosyltransferase involved in cell wall biosynthesis